MFNPQMMGMNNNLPDIPTVQELWGNEKNKYRHWIILLGIGLILTFSLLLASFITNVLNVEAIKDTYVKNLQDTLKPEQLAGKDLGLLAQNYFNQQMLIWPIIKLILLLGGVITFFITVYQSYKVKNFAKLSSLPTIAIGIAAMLAIYQLFQALFLNKAISFEMPGQIFEFSINILFIIFYFSASAPVSKIRKTFIASQRVEQLKNNPQYQAMQEQMRNMMNSQQNGGAANPYYPPAANNNPSSQTTAMPKQPTIKPQANANDNNELKTTNTRKTKLEKMSANELKSVAKELSISGYTKMNKAELISSILKVTGNE